MNKKEGIMRDVEKNYKWRKDNIYRYELTLNKQTNKDAYEHFNKIINKRDYLIGLIVKDKENNGNKV